MKTFKLTVMALLLMTAGAYMSACSDDDEEKTAEQVEDPIQSNVEYYITGKVTENGTGMAGVTINIEGYDAVTTTDNGQFFLTVKEAKEFTVNFTKAGYLNKTATVSLSGQTNRSVATVSVDMAKQEAAVAVSGNDNYIVEPGKATEAESSAELNNVTKVGAYIPKSAISGAMEVSMTAYTPDANLAASAQGEVNAPVTAMYVETTNGDLTATEENPIVLAVRNPSATTAFAGLEVYATTQTVSRAGEEMIGTATYDPASNSYQLKLTSGTLDGGYEFRVNFTRSIGAKQTEVVQEGRVDNSGNLNAQKDVAISYTSQLGWEWQGTDSDMSSFIQNVLSANEGSAGLTDVTYNTQTNVSGESIMYWKAVREFHEVTYTFPTTSGNIQTSLTRYTGIQFTYTVENGRHSGGTSGTQN